MSASEKSPTFSSMSQNLQKIWENVWKNSEKFWRNFWENLRKFLKKSGKYFYQGNILDFLLKPETLIFFIELSTTFQLYRTSHSKTRWLSLFPAVERISKMFDSLKSYFQSHKNIFLLFVHSLMSLFHPKMVMLEKK